MKKMIFTCLFGQYDILNPAPTYPGWDTFLITDQILDDYKGWTPKVFPSQPDLKKQSRLYKILSHRFFPEYDLACYIDANIILLREPPSNPIWGKHYSGRNIFQEARQILALKKESETVIDRQMIFYSNHRRKIIAPLLQNGFFVRRHAEKINRLHELWWEQVETFSYRDQLSLPYAMHKAEIFCENIVQASESRRYFTIKQGHSHEYKFLTTPGVHHITPGRSDKNIGKAINDIVKSLPDNDWICLRDIDTMPMYHEKFFTQCEQIAIKGEFDLVGCITNRLGLNRQLYKNEFSENSDILTHREIAVNLYEKHGSTVKKVTTTIGGVMMLFPKSVWKKVGGFDEGSIVSSKGNFFDFDFCQKVKKNRFKIGVADGIYLFHFYRFGKENPTRATKHLF